MGFIQPNAVEEFILSFVKKYLELKRVLRMILSMENLGAHQILA